MLIYGVNPVLESMKSNPSSIERIVVARGKSGRRLQDIIDLSRKLKIPLSFEPLQSLNRKAETRNHQSVLAEINAISYVDLNDILARDPEILLLLDSVEDPHNLGAVIRTAEAMGVGGVLLPKRRTCGVTPAVVKASAGAAMNISLSRIGNVAQTLDLLKKKGFWTVGLDIKGSFPLEEIDPTLPLVVVVGGEHAGIRRIVRGDCDFLVRLPMYGRINSLNLSVAAGMLLHRLRLQKEESKRQTSGTES